MSRPILPWIAALGATKFCTACTRAGAAGYMAWWGRHVYDGPGWSMYSVARFDEVSSQPWSPPDGTPSSTFWTARLRATPRGSRQALDHSKTGSEGGPAARVRSRPNASTR